MAKEQTLKFSKGNRKLHALAEYLGMPKSHVVSFDLPAGWSCPFADVCLSKADKITGKITDGENCQYRCYAASIESAFTNTRKAHWYNYNLLTSPDGDKRKCKPVYKIVKLINASLPKTAEVVRIHSSGDYFHPNYFNAWVQVASMHPEIIFFGYTKGLQYVKADKPENFKLVYSWGGKLDSKVTSDIPVVYVVKSIEAGIKQGLSLPCELASAGDYFTILNQVSFGIVIHGTQPAKV